MSRSRLTVFLVAALLLGLAAAEVLFRSAGFRDLAGRLSGRGRLVAIANEKGIYETDLGGEDEPSAEDLIVLENLSRVAANEAVDSVRVDREIALLEGRFGDEKKFRKELRSDGLTISVLREKVTNQLRGLDWLEKQIGPASAVGDQEYRAFYEAHRDLFTQPVRFCASHLFLAAHAETPPEIVEEKELAIAEFATRLSQGETLAALAMEASEDEASKPRGGDLGYFPETRALPEFIVEIKKLGIGEISTPFRSRLGFHIAQLTETREAHVFTFEESRPEIALALANDRRSGKIIQVIQDLRRPER